MQSAPFPGRPFALQVDAALVSQNVPGNFSTFTGWIRIVKTGTSPTFSNNPSSSWRAEVNGGTIAAASGLTFDFRTGTEWYLWSGYFNIGHNADGTLPNPSGLAGYASYDILGSTAVAQFVTAPRIPRGPRVLTGGAWRNTVAYVFTGGAWRVVIPYVRTGAAWRVGGS